MSYLKIRMVKSQTHERIHPSYHRHKTFVLVLYTTRNFRAVCAIACWSSWRRPHTIMSVLKIWFSFHYFFFLITTHLRALAQQRYWFYSGLLFQCTSTVKISKNHLQDHLCGLWLRFKKCCHDRINIYSILKIINLKMK